MENEKLTPENEPEITSDDAVPAEDSLEEAVVSEPVAADASRDDLDIDAALAAVASLHDVVTAQESEAEQQMQTAEFTAIDVTPPPSIQQPRPRYFPAPPPSTLPRGSMASVVPALVLIGIGVWLTFALSTDAPPPLLLVVAVALGGVALTLLARWLSAGRWARGTLFIVTSLLLSAVVIGAIAITGALQLYPLLLVAIGAAFWLTAQLARPRDLRLMFPGSLLVVGGVAGLVISSGVLGAEITTIAATVWFVPVILLLILWLIPVLRRGR